jgi:hypothetical protein
LPESPATFEATLSGGHITATRPKHFFRDNSGMPEIVSLPMARPHVFEDLGQSEWASLITDQVRAKEADYRQRRATQGITVLGRDSILRQDPFGCPTGHAPRFQMSPQVAAKNKWARIEHSYAIAASSRNIATPSWPISRVWQTWCFRSAPT